MAKTVYELQQQRELLCGKIANHLDILIGSISTKGPKRPGYNLTCKVDGVTRSRHIRVADLEKVRHMTGQHQKLKELIQELAELNWKILLLQSE